MHSSISLLTDQLKKHKGADLEQYKRYVAIWTASVLCKHLKHSSFYAS